MSVISASQPPCHLNPEAHWTPLPGAGHTFSPSLGPQQAAEGRSEAQDGRRHLKKPICKNAPVQGQAQQRPGWRAQAEFGHRHLSATAMTSAPQPAPLQVTFLPWTPTEPWGCGASAQHIG